MLRWCAIGFCLCTLGNAAFGQDATETTLPVKQQALRWLDRFAVNQALFSEQDVQKLRNKVAGMSDEEAQKWWDDTAIRRELLDSPDWQETQQWLKEFLKVQAIYSDEHIRFFQSEAFTKAQESPRSLKEAMDEITALRRRFASGAKISEATRNQLLASQEAYRQQEVRAREAAVIQSASAAPAAGTIQRRDIPSRYNRPLVTSLDVARWTVLREVFPRW